MKKAIISLVMALICACIDAQELKVKSFERDPLDLTAATSPRQDSNKQYCGLVKVKLPVRGVTFQGNVVGSVSFSGSEYCVYMTALTRFLKIDCPGYKSLLVSFTNYGIGGIEAKSTYIMDIDMSQPAPSTCIFTINFSPSNASLMVDSHEIKATDGTARIRLKPGSYPYLLSADGYTQKMGIIEVSENGSNELDIVLKRNSSSSTPTPPSPATTPATPTPTAKECNDKGVTYYYSKNYTNAVYWFRKAAEQNYAEGQWNLGLMYHNGYGVETDYNEAVYWYRKAAEQNNASGQNSLGVMYHNGHGVEQDYTQAMQWYQKAAAQGNMYAMYNIGLLYEYGYGVTMDKAEAKRWYQKAADKGHETAKEKLTKL